ncbi:MAG: NUDIX hydrolase [Bacillota bacterium]
MDCFSKILNKIENYIPGNKSEKEYKKQTINFLVNNKNNYFRANSSGHLTVSAWIINYDKTKVLLHHHKKLDKWIQLGGHLEKGELIQTAVLREAKEESGLNSLVIVKNDLFDLDIHKIPAFKKEAPHFHYDLRILIKADAEEKLLKSSESKNLQWIKLNKVKNYLSEESVLRMLRKTRNI